MMSWQALLEQVRKNYPDVYRSHKFKTLVARDAEKYSLDSRQFTQIALHFGFKWFPRPKNLPDNWKLILCKSHLSQKYINPIDNNEFVIVKPSHFPGRKPYIIHRTPQGFADAGWFYEIVPQLEILIKDPSTSRIFSENFNLTVNQAFENQRQNMGMTVGQIQAINLFFEKHVPGLENICSSCFKVSLPKSGAGERWTHRLNQKYEVRLSAAKPLGRTGQRVEYVSHRELDSNKVDIFATWNKLSQVAGFDSNMVQEDTHIPWDIYDYHKFKVGMPLCNCLKKMS